jgi:hypothetical protein
MHAFSYTLQHHSADFLNDPTEMGWHFIPIFLILLPRMSCPLQERRLRLSLAIVFFMASLHTPAETSGSRHALAVQRMPPSSKDDP